MSECPKCGGNEWVTHSDGLGDVASVAACCLTCGFLTARSIDLSTPRPWPENAWLTDLALDERGHDCAGHPCPSCPPCPIPPASGA